MIVLLPLFLLFAIKILSVLLGETEIFVKVVVVILIYRDILEIMEKIFLNSTLIFICLIFENQFLKAQEIEQGSSGKIMANQEYPPMLSNPFIINILLNPSHKSLDIWNDMKISAQLIN